MTAVLYISTGIALYSAVLSLQRLLRAPGPQPGSVYVLYALLALSVAAFAGTSAWLQSVPPQYQPLLGKAVVTWGLSSWLALLWLVTLMLRPQRRRLALGLSGVMAGLLLLNLASPASLVYADFVLTRPPSADGLFARLSQGWLLVHAVLILSWGYALWCVSRAAPSAPAWWVALCLLGGASGIDLLITANLLSSAYLSPYVWTLLLMLVWGTVRVPAVERETPPGDTAAAASGSAPDGRSAALTVLRGPPPSATSAPHLLPAAVPGPALHFHAYPDGIERERALFPQDFRVPPPAESGAAAPLTRVLATDDDLARALPTSAADGAEMTAAHALATELTAIVQFARIAQRRIERGKLDAGKLAALFRVIQQKAKHAQDALAGDAPRADIPALIARVLMHADAQLQATGIRVIQRLAPGLPATPVAAEVLEEVLYELLHEAIDATLASPPDAGKPIVLIGRATLDGGIELSIADGGADVSLKEIQGTFESLLAGDDVGETAPLIAAAQRIGAQGGRLWCAPNPAGGSIRYLRLPGLR